MDPPKSTFVTVVAWVFIVLSGLMTLMTLLQNIMIFFLFPFDELSKYQGQPVNSDIPLLLQYVFEHIYLWFLFCFLVSLTTLVSSIGVLLRKELGRKVFVGVLWFTAGWCVLGPFLQLLMFSGKAFASSPVGSNMRTAIVLMLIFTFVFSLGFAVLFAWLARRFHSSTVRAEFRPEILAANP